MATNRPVTSQGLASILSTLLLTSDKPTTQSITDTIEAVVNPVAPVGGLKVGDAKYNSQKHIVEAQKTGKPVDTVTSSTVASTSDSSSTVTTTPVAATPSVSADDVAAKVTAGLTPLFNSLIDALKPKT